MLRRKQRGSRLRVFWLRKVKITGDIINFDTSELWNALRQDDPQTEDMIRILSAPRAVVDADSSSEHLVNALRRRVGAVELAVVARGPVPEPVKPKE